MRLRIKVKPGAPENGFLGLGDDGTLTVAIAARPTDGEANRVLVRFLAREFGPLQGEVRITSGAPITHETIKGAVK